MPYTVVTDAGRYVSSTNAGACTLLDAQLMFLLFLRGDR